jgi:D-glycero-D-manno-heptose 1,7-bisphosphate phosphatase
MRKALFLDRDGVLDDLVYYRSHDEWESPRALGDLTLIEGAAPALRTAMEEGWLLFVVSNQPSAAKGKTSLAALEEVQAAVVSALERDGVRVTACYLCFHHPDGSVPELRGLCRCRKPSPFFLLEAARTYDVDLEASWMIGDQDRDLLAGRAAGCRVALIEYPHSASKRGEVRADLVGGSLAEVLGRIGPGSPHS